MYSTKSKKDRRSRLAHNRTRYNMCQLTEFIVRSVLTSSIFVLYLSLGVDFMSFFDTYFLIEIIKLILICLIPLSAAKLIMDEIRKLKDR